MGLDTIIRRKSDNEELAYWRKCYGVDRWLRSKASSELENDYEFEIDTVVLRDPVEKMEKYIARLITKANNLGYYVEDVESLKQLVSTLYEENIDDCEELEKIIKSFAVDGLDYSAFTDSIWAPLDIFLITYSQFQKALTTDEKVTLISSY